jgi:hypothetical protein
MSGDETKRGVFREGRMDLARYRTVNFEPSGTKTRSAHFLIAIVEGIAAPERASLLDSLGRCAEFRS